MFLHMHESSMSSPSIIYESDTGSDDRPSTPQASGKIQANFQIARPPPKSSLRLAPKLLLQIQQLAPNHRPVPVLGVWQPPFRKSKLTRDFAQRPKLRTGDIYATLDEPFIINSHLRKQSTKSVESDVAATRDITAALCQSGDSESPSSIYFRDAQCSWSVCNKMAGPDHDIPSYRFTLQDEKTSSSTGTDSEPQTGCIILQWEKRPPAKNQESNPNPDSADQFVLMLIDRQARRKSRIAIMTPGGLEVFVRKSSILESLRVCFNLTNPSAATISGRDPHEVLESWLYTHVLTLGVWVASQEGWLGY